MPEEKHCHCHDNEGVSEEAVALLGYMTEHNRHHADELYELANKLDGQARELTLSAVLDMERADEKLERALSLIKNAAHGGEK